MSSYGDDDLDGPIGVNNAVSNFDGRGIRRKSMDGKKAATAGSPAVAAIRARSASNPAKGSL